MPTWGLRAARPVLPSGTGRSLDPYRRCRQGSRQPSCPGGQVKRAGLAIVLPAAALELLPLPHRWRIGACCAARARRVGGRPYHICHRPSPAPGERIIVSRGESLPSADKANRAYRRDFGWVTAKPGRSPLNILCFGCCAATFRKPR